MVGLENLSRGDDDDDDEDSLLLLLLLLVSVLAQSWMEIDEECGGWRGGSLVWVNAAAAKGDFTITVNPSAVPMTSSVISTIRIRPFVIMVVSCQIHRRWQSDKLFVCSWCVALLLLCDERMVAVSHSVQSSKVQI